jgi:hypothetical protein
MSELSWRGMATYTFMNDEQKQKKFNIINAWDIIEYVQVCDLWTISYKVNNFMYVTTEVSDITNYLKLPFNEYLQKVQEYNGYYDHKTDEAIFEHKEYAEKFLNEYLEPAYIIQKLAGELEDVYL